MARRSALEALVGNMSITELAQRSGRSVEEIVDWAMSQAKPGPAPKNGTPPRRTARTKSVNTRTQEGREAYDGAVLEVVRGSDGPVGAAGIRDRVGGTPLQVRAALNRLIESGSITYHGRARATRYQLA